MKKRKTEGERRKRMQKREKKTEKGEDVNIGLI